MIEAVSSDGTVTFQSVPVGTYDLWETKAPANYESVGSGKDTTINVVVAKSGVTFQKPNAVARFFGNLLSGTDDSYSLTGNDLVIYNTHEKGQLTIAKVTTPIPSAAAIRSLSMTRTRLPCRMWTPLRSMPMVRPAQR